MKGRWIGERVGLRRRRDISRATCWILFLDPRQTPLFSLIHPVCSLTSVLATGAARCAFLFVGLGGQTYASGVSHFRLHCLTLLIPPPSSFILHRKFTLHRLPSASQSWDPHTAHLTKQIRRAGMISEGGTPSPGLFIAFRGRHAGGPGLQDPCPLPGMPSPNRMLDREIIL